MRGSTDKSKWQREAREREEREQDRANKRDPKRLGVKEPG